MLYTISLEKLGEQRTGKLWAVVTHEGCGEPIMVKDCLQLIYYDPGGCLSQGHHLWPPGGHVYVQ